MSRSNDPGHYFQTSDSLASIARKKAKSKNKHGNPIRLESKILAILTAEPDETGSKVYVAEAAGPVRRIDVNSRDVTATYLGPNAPSTCLALSPDTRTLFAGCWDKTIFSWNVETRRPAHRYVGHADFVKCVTTANIADTPVLLSGSADSSIIVWDTRSGTKLHTIKGHSRAILDIKIDPTCLANPRQKIDFLTVFACDSAQDIRRWRISLPKAEAINDPIRVHQTSVNRLCFEPCSASTQSDEDIDCDLWTASSDKTAQHLVRARAYESDTVLQHPDFVRDVLLTPDGRHVITACRDEGVRVWDASSGKLEATFDGHFEEVTGLALVKVDTQICVVSASIDATLRIWNLDTASLERAKSGMSDEDGKKNQGAPTGATSGAKTLTTADEDAELAALLEED